jgi:hypothetical protein
MVSLKINEELKEVMVKILEETPLELGFMQVEKSIIHVTYIYYNRFVMVVMLNFLKTKEISKVVKLQVKGGAANPSPPVGPALGAAG